MDNTADILATGQGFDSTQVEFKALTDKGRRGLQALGGGFACVGMTVLKSAAGYYLLGFEQEGCIVSWDAPS